MTGDKLSRLAEKNPWLVDGQICRVSVRAYVDSERKDLHSQVAAGVDAHAAVHAQQARIEQYLEGWSQEDRQTFFAIYSEESTAAVYESINETRTATAKLYAQNDSIRAGAYAVVIVLSIALGMFIYLTR